MNQRNRAENILEKIRLPPAKLLGEIGGILHDAQNAPPLGEADGSINAEAWTALRGYVKSLEAAKRCLVDFRRALS